MITLGSGRFIPKISLLVLFMIMICFVVLNPIECKAIPTGDITWVAKSDMPVANGGNAARAINNKLYVVGLVGGIETSIVYEYDPSGDTWTPKAPMNVPRRHMVLEVVNNKLYAIGGQSTSGSHGISAVVEEYDPLTDKWLIKTSMPVERGTAGGGVINNKIYVVGGNNYSSRDLARVDIYDPSTDSWSRGADMLIARGYLTAAVVNGKLYAIGGQPLSTDIGIANVEEFDPVANEWVAKASMNIPRQSATAIAVNNKIYVLGGFTGYVPGGNPGEYVSSIEEYDPQSNTWVFVNNNMISPRGNFGADTINNKIYVTAGATEVELSSVEEGTIDIPKLCFSDDFENGLDLVNKWSEVAHKGDSGNWHTEVRLLDLNEQCLIQDGPQDSSDPDCRGSFLLIKGKSFSDFTIIADMGYGATTGGHPGIVFRYQDPLNYYVVALGNYDDHEFYLIRVKDGAGTTLGKYKDFEIGTPNKWNKFEIAAAGSSISVSINNTPVATVNDTAFSSGKIGFVSGGNLVQQDHNFDNISVYASECPSDSQWAITYGINGGWQWIQDVKETPDAPDRGYIAVGEYSEGTLFSDDLWVLKLNNNGSIVWQKSYGGSGRDLARSVQKTKDGKYIVVGYTNSYGAGGYDIWILKLDTDGTVLWQKTYGGSADDYATMIQQTNDDGYIVTGYTQSFNVGDWDIWVLKLDSYGTIEWQKTYGGGNAEFTNNTIMQTSDGRYILAANTFSFGAGGYDIWILKLDIDGTIIWQKTYGGSGHDYPLSIQETIDYGYIVAGQTRSFGAGEGDTIVLKLNIDGAVEWGNVYGGSNYDISLFIQQTQDGGYITGGSSKSFTNNSDWDIYLLKLTPSGTVEWEKPYNLGYLRHEAYIAYPSGGGYIIGGGAYNDSSGISNADAFLLKLDADGEIPVCSAMGMSNTIVHDITAQIQINPTDINPINSNALVAIPNVEPYNSVAETSVVCMNMPINLPPVADGQSVRTDEDTARSITLTASDADRDALNFSIVTPPGHGTLSGSAPNVVYAPNPNFNGSDSFTFKVNDGQTDSNIATVAITINPVNDAPVADNQKLSTNEDVQLDIILTGSDIDGDSLSYSLASMPSHGTLTGTPSNITYIPNSDYNGSDSFTFKANDGKVDSNVATILINVIPVNDVPVVNAGPDTIINEGGAFTGDGSFVDPDPDTWAATVDYGDGSGTQPLELNGKTFMLNHIYVDNGSYTVMVTVNDGAASGVDSLVVMVNNIAPSVTAESDQTINEGDTATFSGSFTDPGSDTHTIAWDFGDGKGTTGTLTPSHIYADNGTYTVTVIVTDDDGGIGADTVTVTVNNVAPVVGSITATIDPVMIGTAITVSAPFTDSGIIDTHTATWDWGDGTTSSGTVSETYGSGTVQDTHKYVQSGVYTITLTVTDKDGDSGTAVFQYVVVYDPDGGFVTGGGWINSPAGAYVPNPSLTGKATFGFVSKYKKGATVPTGNTEFQFKVANLNFHSESYQWLVVAGAKAQYKGYGTINGQGNYGFILTAIDGDLKGTTDKFRIKIWDKDNNDARVYDNLLDAPDDADPTTVIGGGSIVIHKR